MSESPPDRRPISAGRDSGEDDFEETARRGRRAHAKGAAMFGKLRLEIDRLAAKRKAVVEGDASARHAKLLSFYIRVMTKITESERCSVFIYDPARNMVWLKAGTGVQEHEIEVPKQDSVVGKVIASGEPAIVNELESKPGAHKIIEQSTGFVTRNILCVPIKSPTRNETTGAFQLLNKMNARDFTNDDLALAKEVAEHLQEEVDRIFLDQEVFGLTERLYSAASMTMNFLAMSVVLTILIAFLGLAAWGILPRVFAG